MESLHSLLVKRRSIRHYSDEPVSEDDIKLILEAALLSPTSKSARAWQFVVVNDKETIESLAQCKPMGADPLRRAPLAIVVAVDPTATEPWIEDASVAATCMMMQAADLGLGCCWIQVRDRYSADGLPAEEYIQGILGMPDTLPVVCVLAIGHPAQERKPQDLDKLKWEQVHLGKWTAR